MGEKEYFNNVKQENFIFEKYLHLIKFLKNKIL